MSESACPSPSNTGRRDAIKSLAGGAFALASLGAAACATPAQAVSTAPRPVPPLSGPGNWDMSWLQRVNKRRRMVFDTSEVADGMGIAFVAAYLQGAADAYGDPDASTVLVHRHASVSVVLNDDMWKRLGLGESNKIKDSKTGEFVQKNPFLSHNQAGQEYESSLDKLMEKGTIVVACNRALTARAFTLASKEKISRDDARKQLFAAIIPGVYVVPNGVFGVCAAQEVGCGYITVRN
jgi:intracellular sulfur oxidation DsrE/DsrF family protein